MGLMQVQTAAGQQISILPLAPAGVFAAVSILIVFSLWVESAAHAGDSSAQDWPAWRGDGSGVSTKAADLPTQWDGKANIAWKAVIAGEGNSSPIICDAKVILTACDEEGRRRSVICLDVRDGHVVWQTQVKAVAVFPTEPKNGYASATCTTDGKSVYAFFDSPGLVALDISDGKILWQHALGPFTTRWGLVASPLCWHDRVIIACDHEKGAFIAAFDKSTGEPRWRTAREDRMGFSVPLLIDAGGREQLVLNGQNVVSYDPDSGRALWTCRGMKDGCVPTAQYLDGLVWVTSGRNGPVMAIDPTGSGDVTDTHVRIRLNSGGCYVTSPLVVGQRLMLPGDDGNIRLLERDGRVAAQSRVRGHFCSSPVRAGNLIYWANETGTTYVFAADAAAGSPPTLRTIAQNELQEPIHASPAISGNQLFLRTATSLYCIRGTQPVGAKPDDPVGENTPVPTLAEIEARYRAHPADYGPDVAMRLDAVDATSRLKGPEVARFLMTAARDPHWDVSTAAAKALARLGPVAVDELIDLLRQATGQEYLNIIAAESLGEMRVVKAVPGLVDRMNVHYDPGVRIAALRALSSIATAPGADIEAVATAIMMGLGDSETTVKLVAIEAARSLPALPEPKHEAIAKGLQACAKDCNPNVANAATKALAAGYQ